MADGASPGGWRIGDLAAATGLTVRALHHYEALGLLVPRRTDGNHRLYDADDVRRLYRIRALRGLGVPLAEIARTLDGHGLAGVLRAQRARVDRELARLAELRARLDAVDADTPAPDLLAVMEAMSRVDAHVARGRRPGSAERWRALGERLRARRDAGDAPDAPEVRAVAREVHAALVAFAGPDPDLLAALARLRRHAPPRALAGWDPPLLRFLDDALLALDP